ncbi:MAG TPA: hypothetical protein VGK29_15660 [Paludibaculum sp.]|jgi:hypothetical protein
MRFANPLPLLALSGLLLADDDANKTKVTGCLSKHASGEITLTDSAGKKLIATGSAELEKHAANHKVTLEGTEKTTEGKTVLQVERITHISNTCETPTSN